MIVCRVSDPALVVGWKEVFTMELCAALPREPVSVQHPNWRENVIERSFLRQPEIIAKAIGIRAPTGGFMALRQVARIDLYLRGGRELHLLELKRPTEYGQWQFAANEIVRQWSKSAVWLRRDCDSVHLWVLSPVRWSRSKRTAKIPSNWRQTLAGIAQQQLTGRAQAEIGMLFYGFVGVGRSRYLLMWKGGEATPAFDGN